MNQMTITLLVILILAVVLLFPIIADISYDNDNDFKVVARLYWFIKLKLYPKEPKKVKKKKDDTQQTEQTQKQLTKKEKKSYELLELLDISDKLLPQAIKMLSILRRTFYISKLYVNTVVSDEDAAETAIKYGKISMVIWVLVGAIKTNFYVTAKPNINITPNFNTQNESFAFKTRINICLLAAILIIIYFAIKALIIIIKNKALDKSADTRQRQYTHRGGSGD